MPLTTLRKAFHIIGIIGKTLTGYFGKASDCMSYCRSTICRDIFIVLVEDGLTMTVM